MIFCVLEIKICYHFRSIAEAMPKPKNKKKVFIDKKNAVSFQLVHRSQQVRLAKTSSLCFSFKF